MILLENAKKVFPLHKSGGFYMNRVNCSIREIVGKECECCRYADKYFWFGIASRRDSCGNPDAIIFVICPQCGSHIEPSMETAFERARKKRELRRFMFSLGEVGV